MVLPRVAVELDEGLARLIGESFQEVASFSSLDTVCVELRTLVGSFKVVISTSTLTASRKQDSGESNT